MGAIVYKYTKAPPPPSRSPSPVPLTRLSPSPSCSGKRPKVERWRGVNGLANDGLITTLQTIVGRWPPCHVLQHPIYVIIMEDGYHYGGRLSHGGRGAETLVLLSLLCLAFFCFALVVVGFALRVVGFCAIISRTVVSVPRPQTLKIGYLGVVVKQLFANK